MTRTFFSRISATGCALLGLGISCGTLRAEQKPVSFRAEIAPLLLEQCQTCHGPTEQKGGYRLDTFEFLSRGEDGGEGNVVPGHPEKSDFFKLLISSDADERMPKKAPRLPATQTELVKRWIAEGAHFDGEEKSAALVEIIPARVHPKAPEAYALPIPITALAFSPDGTELFASGFRELTVWNPADGKLLRRISNVAPRTFELSFNSDGTSLAAASGAPGEFGEVRLFDPNTGQMQRQLLSSTDAVLDVKFSVDGKMLVASSADHTLSIFDLGTGRRRHRLTGHSDAVTSLAISPDGKRVASVGLDRAAKVFDAETGKLVTTYRDHTGPLYSVAFTADGSQVMSAGRDKSLHQWNVADGKKQRELKVDGDIMRVVCTQAQIYVGGSGKKLFQASIAELKAGQPFEGMTDWIYAVAVDPVNKRIAAGSYDGTVLIWDMAGGGPLIRFIASPGYKAGAAEGEVASKGK